MKRFRSLTTGKTAFSVFPEYFISNRVCTNTEFTSISNEVRTKPKYCILIEKERVLTLVFDIVEAGDQHKITNGMMQDKKPSEQLVERSVDNNLERVVDVESGGVFK